MSVQAFNSITVCHHLKEITSVFYLICFFWTRTNFFYPTCSIPVLLLTANFDLLSLLTFGHNYFWFNQFFFQQNIRRLLYTVAGVMLMSTKHNTGDINPSV